MAKESLERALETFIEVFGGYVMMTNGNYSDFRQSLIRWLRGEGETRTYRVEAYVIVDKEDVEEQCEENKRYNLPKTRIAEKKFLEELNKFTDGKIVVNPRYNTEEVEFGVHSIKGALAQLLCIDYKTEEGDVVPLISEAALYEAVGKQNARSILSAVRSILEVVVEPEELTHFFK